MAGPFDLTGQNIENTYQRVLQTPDGTTFYDGTGSLVTLPSADVSGLVTTSSFNAFTASINTFTSSYNTGSFSGSFTGSLNGTASYYQETDPVFVAKSASLATTGSNIFIGNQTVTGSLFTTGSNTLIGTTTLTGSLNITGSTTQTGNNTLIGNTLLSGSIIVSGSQGPGSPTASVQIYGDIRQNGYHRFDPVTTNIDTSISASYIYVSGSTKDLYFSQNGNGYNNVTRLRWLESNLYTGLLHGGLISQINSTTYQISSGSGIIVNLNASYNDDPYPIVQFLNWPNLSASIAPLSASFDQSFVAINSNIQITASGIPYNDGDYNTLIPIGIVLHQNRSTINAFQTFPSVGYGWKQRSYDFIKAFGPLKIANYNLTPSSSRGLLLGGGTSWVDGRNYTVDPNNPSYIVETTGITTSKIFKYHQSGSGWVYDTNAGVGYTTIDPTQYSNSGSLTLVPSNNWSIQRVFYFPNSATKAFYVYYGNAVYSNKDNAIAGLLTEPFNEAPNTFANAIFVGYIILRNNADFTTAASYEFRAGGLFRGVGGGGGGGGGGTGTSITLQTNGTNNGSQTVLNLKQGSNVSLSDDGVGGITISSTGGGGGGNNTSTGSYGSFYDTTIQTIDTVGAVYSMSLNNAPISNGVSLSGSTNPYNTYIKMANAGVYDIQFSAQLDKTSGQTGVAYIWLRKNGTDLSETNTAVTLAGGANDKAIAAWNWFVDASAGDYYQLMWAATNNNIRLYSTGSGAIDAAPAIPSLIVTANRIDQFLSNTGSFTGSFTGVFTGSLLGTASTASYYQETDPIFTAKSASLATTGSNNFIGNQTITGSLIHGLEGNIATGEYSHAEGSITQAIGDYSHAEGDFTQAIGNYSHAEGQNTIALGQYSHAEGNNTITSASWQHVQGQWNATSSVPAAFIVGNGTDNDNRSNLIHAAGNEVQITGSIVFNEGARITPTYYGNAYTGYIDIVAGGPNGFVELLSYNSQSSLTVDDFGIYMLTSASKLWQFKNNGILEAPGGIEAPSFTGSLQGTASWAQSASQALTASFVRTAQTASYVLQAVSASFATTASFALTYPYNSTSSILGNGSSTSFNINHGFNTRNLHITVYDSASGDIVYPDLKHVNVNTSSITFANPPSSSQYVVYISQ